MDPQDYKGMTLGEKKAMKEKEGAAAAHIQRIKDKLGANWSVKFLWSEIVANIAAGEKQSIPGYFYDRFIRVLADDIDKMDADVVAAFNEGVGGNREIAITVSAEAKGNYENGGGRYRFEGMKGQGLKITWGPDKLGYGYPYNDRTTLDRYVQDQTVEGGEYAGMTLYEKKKLKEAEPKGLEAVKKIVDKLGNNWQVRFLWPEIAANIAADERQSIPGYFYGRFAVSLGDQDILKMDSDVVEALNEAVGDNKHITVTVGNDKGDYENGGGRYRIEGLKEGVKITWGPNKLGYGYPCSDSKTVKQFVLDHC